MKNKHIETKLWRSTHAHKHKCVPFLLARSSFRGLSKNMASEEDAFKRQEKSSLRVPDLPLLKTCCWLGSGRGPPEGPHRDQLNPQEPAWSFAQCPGLRETGNGCTLKQFPCHHRPSLSLFFPYCKLTQHAEKITCIIVTAWEKPVTFTSCMHFVVLIGIYRLMRRLEREGMRMGELLLSCND